MKSDGRMSDTTWAKGERLPLSGAYRTRASVPIDHLSDTLFITSLVIVFLALGLVGILHHEMWRDELQAWLIARDSSSLIDLFHNLRYEKHPGLWHLYLYLLSRFTSHPLAMQLFHLAIATGVVFLFIKFSPFSKLQKALFPFGYFPFFEYAVISRSYALGVLLIFSFCALYVKSTKNYLALSGVLFLLSNTSLYGLIIAVALSFALLLQAVTDKSSVRLSGQRLKLGGGLLMVAIGVGVSLVQIIPPSSGAVAAERDVVTGAFDRGLSLTPDNRNQAIRALKTIWSSYVPVPQLSTNRFWNTNFLSSSDDPIPRRAGIVFSLGLIALVLLLFAPRPPIFFAYLTGTGAILLFISAVNFGALRHHGHLFILFIACLWISASEPPSNWLGTKINNAGGMLRNNQSRFVTTLLCFHLAAGVFAFSVDFFKPFSASKAAAEFIEQHQLSNMLIVSRPDFISTPLSVYLGRKIYRLESDDAGTFIVWTNKRRSLKLETAFDKLSTIVETEKSDVLFVSNVAVKDIPTSLRVSELATFTEAIVSDETYYLYLVHK